MFRVGIVGCGGIAYWKHTMVLKKMEDIEMVAFCDIVVERAEKFAADYGVEGARVYKDYKEMFAKEKGIMDVVHVCTPNNSHAEISIAAMEDGDCHVLCEKPMAITYIDALAMIDAHKRTGKKLTIGYQNRFAKESTYLKEACDNGELGEIYFAKATASRRRGVPVWGEFLNKEVQGGGPLMDIGTHALDLTLWCMDNYKVESVMGNIHKKLFDQKKTANQWGDWNTEKFTVEDSAFGFVKMKNGATIIVESSWAINMLDTQEAVTTLAGTKAGGDMKDGVRINFVENDRQTVKKPDLNTGGVPHYGAEAMNADEIEARHWFDAIKNNTDPLVLPEQAAVVTRVLEAIYKSAETGELVKF